MFLLDAQLASDAGDGHHTASVDDHVQAESTTHRGREVHVRPYQVSCLCLFQYAQHVLVGMTTSNMLLCYTTVRGMSLTR